MNRSILKLTLPNVISNISIPLLGFVDLVLIGRLGDEVYIGAIALGGMIFNILYWSFGFLRMGTSGLTAQSYGEKNDKASSLILSRSFIIAVLGGLLLMVLQTPIELLIFSIVDGSNEVEVLAAQYYYIRIYAAPATLSLYVLTGWFLGMQNARIPMIITLVVNVLNIILSYCFIYLFDMKSDGVALGTLIAQYLGLGLGLFFLGKRFPQYIKLWKLKVVLELGELKRFFKINIDIFIRTLCLIIVFTFFTSQSASTNNSILAINTLLLQFLFIFSYLIDGFAYAAEALTGKFVGEKNIKDLKRLISILFYWGLGVSLLFSGLYLVGGEKILSLMTNNNELIMMSREYMVWIVLIPVISFPSFLWDGVYIGATASRAMRNTMLVSTVMIFFPLFYLFRDIMGNHSLWFALILFLAARGVSQSFLAKKAIFTNYISK